MVKTGRRGLLVAVTLLVALTILVGVAYAQTYFFSVPRERVDLYWQPDGSLTVEYEIVFNNSATADAIDFVDIGLPTNDYSISNITATVDGNVITDIEDSPYVTYGVALGLGSHAILPGQQGVVRMQASGIRNVLYTDNDDNNYASAVFSPSYFDSQFVSGSTDLTVVYHLPPGVEPSEPRWHSNVSAGFGDQPETGFDGQGRITYTWNNPQANAYSFYIFGASFPTSYVPDGAIQQPSFSQRTGIDFEEIIPIFIFCCFCLFFIGIIAIGVISERRRRLKYLPPKVSIAGHGIKRGLTAPEAAILLEQPMDKILTMILFSVIKKGAASVTQRDPLKLELSDPLPDGLRDYEDAFLLAFAEGSKSRQRKELQQLMVKLVKSVANKMRGFSKRETVAYYKKIIEDAWLQVAAADTPKVQSERFEEELEWTMMDRDYDRRTREVFRGPVYVPTWWGNYDPGYDRSVRSSGPSASKPSSVPSVGTGGGAPSLPSLPGSDFAASVVGGVQNMAGGVIGSLSDFTGGVTKVTNPPPKPSPSRSGGGWSGGGSSCACACAGCACACAGGGR